MKRGEVWWANLPKPVGGRPVLLLSRNAAYSVGFAPFPSRASIAAASTKIQPIGESGFDGNPDCCPPLDAASLARCSASHLS